MYTYVYIGFDIYTHIYIYRYLLQIHVYIYIHIDILLPCGLHSIPTIFGNPVQHFVCSDIPRDNSFRILSYIPFDIVQFHAYGVS